MSLGTANQHTSRIHPEENDDNYTSIVRLILAGGTPASQDCEQFMKSGCLVKIVNNGAGILVYKFSDNPVSTVTVAAGTSSAVGAILPPQTVSEACRVPSGKKYLHMVSTAATNISITRASKTKI